MYLGLVLCLLGWAVLFGSLVPLAVVPAFFALIHVQFVMRKEPPAPLVPVELLASAARPVRGDGRDDEISASGREPRRIPAARQAKRVTSSCPDC